MDGHDQSDESVDQEQGHGGGLRHRLQHLWSHGHDHGTHSVEPGESVTAGIKATKISLVVLGITAALQAVIVIMSGSVALLSDTLHNLGDALTAIPLWIAFLLGRRKPTRTYTYGFHRAEDMAGLLIVLAIGGTAVLVGWESIRRLFEPRLIDQIPWVIAAGLVGAAGNELVARYRIRVGLMIGSEALVADGQHARSDAWTSLAVVAAGIGAAFGLSWVDPAAGLVVSVVIFVLLVRSARGIGRRLLDGVDPELVATAERVILSVEDVREVTDLRVRFHGHQLHISASIAVAANLTVLQAHETAHAAEHELHHAFNFPVVATIHIDPHGVDDAHQRVAHHR